MRLGLKLHGPGDKPGFVRLQVHSESRCNFGQHKLEGTLIGIGLWLVAGYGIACGWLGAWGYAIWIPLIALGLFFVLIIGHFLGLLLLPIEILRRNSSKRTRPKEPPHA